MLNVQILWDKYTQSMLLDLTSFVVLVLIIYTYLHFLGQCCYYSL